MSGSAQPINPKITAKADSDQTASINFPLPVQAILFDLDGTLVHSAPDIVASIQPMLADLGRPGWPAETIASWIGNGAQQLVKRALTGQMHAQPPTALYEQALAIFLRHYAQHLAVESRPYPGVVETLAQLHQAGFKLACITNKAARFTEPLLQSLDLARYFQIVMSGDSLPKKKPDPLPLEEVCRQFGMHAHQALMIGDSRNDIEAARSANMPIICVTYGYNHGRDIREQRPDAVIDQFADLSRYVCVGV